MLLCVHLDVWVSLSFVLGNLCHTSSTTSTSYAEEAICNISWYQSQMTYTTKWRLASCPYLSARGELCFCLVNFYSSTHRCSNDTVLTNSLHVITYKQNYIGSTLDVKHYLKISISLVSCGPKRGTLSTNQTKWEINGISTFFCGT